MALVTGAGRGFGRAIAARFAERARGSPCTTAAAVTAPSARGRRDPCGAAGRPGAVAADLTRDGDAARVVDEVAEAFGRLDVLVNNAGAYPLVGLLEMTGAQWDEVVRANFTSAFALPPAPRAGA